MLRWLLLLVVLSAGRAEAQQPLDGIDLLIAGYLAREHIPGAVLVVMREDELVLNHRWGMTDPARETSMTPGVVQPIYSTSKQFTAALVLRLVERGGIDLDAPVGRYLPEYFADEPQLRIRHLLRHTSGLPDFIRQPEVLALERAAPGTGSLTAMVALLDTLPRRFAPGTRHAYSNANYTVLALVAERVSGRPFAVAQRELLLRPLGLAEIDECSAIDAARISPGHDANGAEVRLPRNSAPSYSGNGGLCATAIALARWTRALGAGRVVRPDLLSEMQRGIPVEAGYTPPYGFGLSTLPLAGRPAFSHAGGGDGWGAWTAWLPEEQITIALLANRGWLWSTDLGVPLVRLLTGQGPPLALSRLRLTAAERAALSGPFEDGLFEISLRADRDRLWLHNRPFGDPIELWKQPDGRFVSPTRPDTFSLRLVDGRPEFDWMEHRSYLVRRPAPRLNRN